MSKTNERWLHTPEGIPLRFTLAPLGDRAAAFMIDGLIIFAITIVLAFALSWIATGRELFGAIFMLAVFALRTLYFPLFELRWRGQTPGKRMQKLRTISADGGPLTPRAIFARNLTREFEVFLPLVLLFAPELIYQGSGGLWGLLSMAWLLVFMWMPAFNRDKLRVGDLIAGTRVVQTPRVALLGDMSQQPLQPRAHHRFTPAQLSHYGNYELQVLEEILRDGDTIDRATLDAVAQKIIARIEWQGPAPHAVLGFLQDFYAAQRAHLERGLLFGKSRADKHAARGTPDG
jgi:uncharacterized RDD family membrane protein YckC